MFPRTVSRANSRHHLRAQCAILQARILAKPSVRMMLAMVMGIAKCVLHACVATCARRPMRVFARCTACAMQARFARCAKWRSGPGPSPALMRANAKIRPRHIFRVSLAPLVPSHRFARCARPPLRTRARAAAARVVHPTLFFAYYSYHSSHRTLFFTYYSYHL